MMKRLSELISTILCCIVYHDCAHCAHAVKYAWSRFWTVSY